MYNLESEIPFKLFLFNLAACQQQTNLTLNENLNILRWIERELESTNVIDSGIDILNVEIVSEMFFLERNNRAFR